MMLAVTISLAINFWLCVTATVVETGAICKEALGLELPWSVKSCSSASGPMCFHDHMVLVATSCSAWWALPVCYSMSVSFSGREFF